MCVCMCVLYKDKIINNAYELLSRRVLDIM